MTSRKLFQAGPIFLFIVFWFTIISSKSLNAAPPDQNIKYAGLRSSCYGIAPFPDPQEWGQALDTMSGCFKAAQPIAIWLVGTVNTANGDADLEFPSPGGWYSKITFAASDKHKNYLNYFDANGIKVWFRSNRGSPMSRP